MNPALEARVYPLIGEKGFARITAAFFELVRADDTLRAIYQSGPGGTVPDGGWPGAEERLRDFLVFRFGGPHHYTDARGHPRLRARHARFSINPDAASRWLTCMNTAIDRARIDPRAAELLRPYMADTAAFLVNRPG